MTILKQLIPWGTPSAFAPCTSFIKEKKMWFIFCLHLEYEQTGLDMVNNLGNMELIENGSYYSLIL